jgi:hypothetical protein
MTVMIPFVIYGMWVADLRPSDVRTCRRAARVWPPFDASKGAFRVPANRKDSFVDSRPPATTSQIRTSRCVARTPHVLKATEETGVPLDVILLETSTKG